MDSRDRLRRICIATSTRADWGLLSPIAKALASRDDCHVDIAATNMHLSQRFGMTVNDIIADGFEPLRVPMDADDDSDDARVKAMASCMTGFADVFAALRPDMLILLGDRYEMLAVASTAEVLRIPVVHIAGGTISEGAIDDCIRHAITKLSALHLVETEEHRRRVIAMGEMPDRVVNAGAIGVWNIMNMPLMSRERLEADLSFDLGRPFAVSTFHPATLDPCEPAARCRSMLDALDRHPDLRLIITYPNNDARSSGIIKEIERYVSLRPERAMVVKSLGVSRYLSIMQFAEFVIGNSSSGIVEAASLGIPSIDIGIRQRGRTAAPSVIHCGDSADEIDSAIRLARSPEVKVLASRRINPYYRPDTLQVMIDAIMNADPKKLILKTFHDIRPC